MRSFVKSWGFVSLSFLAAGALANAAPVSTALTSSAEELRALDVSGVLLDAKLFAQFSAEQLNENFASLGVKARNGVKLYRISYISHTPKNQVVKASGLIAVPDAEAPLYPWISLQHGTIASKADAPSLNPREGLFEASQGFVTVVADYLGYGDSDELFHPYIIGQAYVDSNVAMLRAARQLAKREGWNLGPLFLKGYSEGGYATLAVQRALDTTYAGEFPVLASAPSAGPYAPDATGKILTTKEQLNPVNVPFIILSYNKWFGRSSGLDLDAIFIPAAADVEETLSGAYSGSEIAERLPSTTAELMEPAFLADFALPDGEQTLPDVRKLNGWLKSQSLLNGDWVPSVPTKFYHCVDDEQVPAVNTELAVAHYSALNPEAPVTAAFIPSPPEGARYNHGNCPAIFAPVQWFGEILMKAAEEADTEATVE